MASKESTGCIAFVPGMIAPLTNANPNLQPLS